MKKHIALLVLFVAVFLLSNAQVTKPVVLNTSIDFSKINFSTLKKSDLVTGVYKSASTYQKYAMLVNMPSRYGILKTASIGTKQAVADNGIRYYISKNNIQLPAGSTGTTSTSSQDNQALVCQSTPISLGRQFASGLLMIPSSQSIENTKIYPGALFSDEDVIKGRFVPLNLPRKPGTIAINVVSSNPVVRNVSNFNDKNTVTSAISQLLSAVGNSAAGTDHFSTSLEVKAGSELSLNLESSTSVNLETLLKFPLEIGRSVNAGVTLSTEFNTAVAYIRNINYIISVGGENDGGGPQSTIQGTIPANAVCVTDVMYGSVAFIVVSNLKTRAEAKAVASNLLNIADVASSNNSLSAEAKAALETNAVTVMVYGGAGASSVNSVTSVQQLRTELAKGNNSVGGVNAAPVFYALSYASDNAPVKTAAFSGFTDTRCFKASKLEVTLESFKPLNVVDFGDEELYGELRIDCNGNSTTDNRRFWLKSKSNAVQGAKGVEIGGKITDKLVFNINPAVVGDFDNEMIKVGMNLKDVIEAVEWAFTSDAGKSNGFVQYTPTFFNNVSLADIRDAGDGGLRKTYSVTEGGASVEVKLLFKLKP